MAKSSAPNQLKSQADLEAQRYMSIADICAYSNLSRTMIFEIRKSKDFPKAVLFGKRQIYPTAAIVNFFDRRDAEACAA